MATTVDELIVRIKADTKQLESSLNRVRKQTKETFNERSSNRFVASLRNIRGAAAAAAVGLGAVAAVKVAQTGAEFENLKLSLQAVYGSAQAGDAAFSQIRQFASEMPFQVQDLSKAFIQLKTAGIEPTRELLMTYADASSVAMDSLGAFQAMVRITQRSAAGGLGLEELEQISDRGIPVYEILAERLGVTRQKISDMGKTAEGAAKLMKTFQEGLKEGFGGTVALKMETLNQKLSNMSDAFDGLAMAIFEDSGVGKGMKALVDLAKDFANSLAVGIKMLSTGQSAEMVKAVTLEEKLAVAVKERQEIEDRALKNKAGEIVNATMRERLKQADATVESLRKEVVQRDKLNIKNKADAQAAKEAKDAKIAEFDAQQAADKAREKSIENLRGLLNDVKTPAEQVTEKIQRLNAELILIGKGGESEFTPEQLAEAIKRLGEEMTPLEKKTKKVKEKTDELAKTMKEHLLEAVVENINAFTTDFVNALMNGESALESFKDFAKKMISQIIAQFLQLQVVNKIVNTLTTAFGGSPTTDAATDVGATGGRLHRGRMTLVGEQGPELFIPNSGGTLMNAQNTRGALGGGGAVVVNQNINLSAGVAGTVRQEVIKMMPMISDITKAGVLEASARGGNYRRGLLGA